MGNRLGETKIAVGDAKKSHESLKGHGTAKSHQTVYSQKAPPAVGKQTVITHLKGKYHETTNGKSAQPNNPIKPTGSTPVLVNVYEHVKLQEHLSKWGIPQNGALGAYHTGIQVHGTEFYYWGHPSEKSGIFRMRQPRDLKSLSENFNSEFRYMQSLRLGYTEDNEEQVRALVSLALCSGICF